MATCTCIASGNYSAASGVWSGGSGPGGVPGAGDTCVVNAPYVISQDATTVLLAGISDTGTWKLPTAAGSFTLNCSGDISVENLLGGTSGSPIPATTDAQIQLTTTSGIISSSNVQIYGAPNPIGTAVSISTSAISSVNPANTSIVTATAHNLVVGMQVTIAGHAGNTGINGYWCVMRVNSATSFDIGYQTIAGGTGGTATMGTLAYFLSSACNGSTTVQVYGDATGWNALRSGLPAGRAHVWINRYTAQVPGTTANCEAVLSNTVPITYNSSTNTSTITLATALPENKEIGSCLVFECRNVLIQSNSAAHMLNYLTNAVTVYCEFRSAMGYAYFEGSNNNATGASFAQNSYASGSTSILTLTGASFTGNASGVYYGTSHILNGAVFNGNGYAINTVYGVTANGTLFFGNTYPLIYGIGCTLNGAAFLGNTQCLWYGEGSLINGVLFEGNNGTIYSGIGHTVIGALFASNLYGLYVSIAQIISCLFSNSVNGDIIDGRDCQCINCTLSSTTQSRFTDIKPVLTNRWRTISYNDSSVAGAIKSWTLGGATNYPSSTVPSGSNPGAQYAAMQTHLMTLTDAGYPSWYDSRPITLPPNRRYVATWWGQKSVNGMVATPQVQIVDLFNDPLVIPGATPLASATMIDNSGTWQLFRLAVQNTGTASLSIVVRTVATNGSGTINFNYLERTYASEEGDMQADVQIGKSIPFVGEFTTMGQSATGLTVTADVYISSSSTPLIAAAAATEIGDGQYTYVLAGSVTTTNGAGDYICIFKTSSVIPDSLQCTKYAQVGAAHVQNMDSDTATIQSGITSNAAALTTAQTSLNTLTTNWTATLAANLNTTNATVANWLTNGMGLTTAAITAIWGAIASGSTSALTVLGSLFGLLPATKIAAQSDVTTLNNLSSAQVTTAVPSATAIASAVNVAGALSSYGTATAANVNGATATINAHTDSDTAPLATATALTAAIATINGHTDTDVAILATPAQVTNALTTYGAAKPADVATQLTNYGTAKTTDVTTAASATIAAMPTPPSTAAIASAVNAAHDGDAMSLTPAAITAIATAIPPPDVSTLSTSAEVAAVQVTADSINGKLAVPGISQDDVMNTGTISFLGPHGLTPTITVSVDNATPVTGQGSWAEYGTGQFSYTLTPSELAGTSTDVLVAFTGYQPQLIVVSPSMANSLAEAVSAVTSLNSKISANLSTITIVQPAIDGLTLTLYQGKSYDAAGIVGDQVNIPFSTAGRATTLAAGTWTLTLAGTTFPAIPTLDSATNTGTASFSLTTDQTNSLPAGGGVYSLTVTWDNEHAVDLIHDGSLVILG